MAKARKVPLENAPMEVPGVSAKDVPLGAEVLGKIKVVKDVYTKVTGEWQGLPYVGPNLTLKNSDSADKLPQLDIQAHAQIFHVEDAAELKAYELILQQHYTAQVKSGGRSVPQLAIITKDLRYDETTGKRSIMLEWYEARYVAPKQTV